jgi:hypothetical protein
MMGMRCAFDRIGMFVIVCSVVLDDKGLFTLLVCWILVVLLTMVVIQCADKQNKRTE